MSEWISVDDRLPENSDNVLIWPRPEFHDYCYVGCYECWAPKEKQWRVEYYDGYGTQDFYPNVTHWAPLLGEPGENKDD